jgi:hypothetical protein
MRTVCTFVAQNAFAATMSAMRLWLDQNGNPEVRFETATDGVGILIILEFHADGLAYAFEHRFGNMPPDTRVIAA